MNPERERLICMLVGLYIGKKPDMTGIDLHIAIDQHLQSHNQSPLNKDDSDLLEELVSETMWLALTKHGIINRETKRKFGIGQAQNTKRRNGSR